MMKATMNANTRLTSVFQRSLGVELDDFESLEYRAIPEWDSVAHMTLVSELESEFDVMLDTDEVIGMSSFRKAREILQQQGVDFGA